MIEVQLKFFFKNLKIYVCKKPKRNDHNQYKHTHRAILLITDKLVNKNNSRAVSAHSVWSSIDNCLTLEQQLLTINVRLYVLFLNRQSFQPLNVSKRFFNIMSFPFYVGWFMIPFNAIVYLSTACIVLYVLRVVILCGSIMCGKSKDV